MMINPAKLILLLIVSIFVLSCSKEDDQIEKPDISDDIPYDVIGSGKILINRFISSRYFLINGAEQSVSELKINPVGDCIISPDGKMIAYASSNDILHLINIDGSVYAEQTYTNQCFQKISWSMDSKRIIYLDACYSDPENLYELNIDKPCCTNNLVRTFSRSFPYSGISSPFSLSVDNDMAFYVIENEAFPQEEFQQSGIYTINKVGEDLKCIFTDDSVGFNSGKSFSSPVWSPSGEKIAFASNIFGDDQTSSEIILIDPDGSNAETIVKFDKASTNEAANRIGSLCWSPGGNKIAFIKYDDYQTSHVFILELKTNKITQITFGESLTDGGISWSK